MNCKEKKKELDSRIRSELFAATKINFPSDDKVNKVNVTRAITNKLQSLSKLFELVKSGQKYNLQTMRNLSKFDVIGFSDFYDYEKNPSLFKKLDEEIDNDCQDLQKDEKEEE